MADAPQEASRIGTVVAGRYRIDELLGVGGMGAVYRADDAEQGRPVALKILLPHLGSNPEATARFRREAVVGGKIAHPNCVGIADVGTCEDGAIYLAMELLDGESLGAVLARERRIPWRRALHIARHILRGLAHAHDQGVVHRDIKPDNVFLCPRDGDPDLARVLDFGIAKLVGGGGAAITQAGLTVGTPDYVSPEQALGGELDRRTDLYSLSVVLFEMLTGATPFADRDVMKILIGHASREVPTFRAVAPDLDVPDAVEALVRDGLAKRPAERIPSAAAYLARIDALLAPPVDATDTVPDGGVGVVIGGRYSLERVIGRGGMGRVYRATHVGLARAVAIKVLDPTRVGDDDARRRFEREAQATARLRHPNCVAVTDFGATRDGGRFLVMDLVEGITLAELLANESQLSVARAFHIMRHVLRGLAHAHEQGLVHRDLKPTNIMLASEDGDPEIAKILDFGLARVVGGDDQITRTGIACGTPRYMSPEQVLSRTVDARADLYAASVILFEMLAGRTPYEHDDTMTLLKMHLSAPVPRIAEVAPGVVVPEALEGLIRRGLAKQPDERPATAEAYLVELERALAPAAAAAHVAAAVPAPVPAPPSDPTMHLSSLESMMVPAVTPPRPAPVRDRRPRPRLDLRSLTPRQRLVGGAVAAVVLIGIVAAVVGGGSSASPATTGATAVPAEPELEMEPESAPSLDPAVEEALRLARAGRTDEAASRLRALRRKRPDDPQIPYALGRVYHRLGWPKETLAAYRAAMRLDPALREDAQLIADVVAILASRSTWKAAARMLEDEIGSAAVPTLAQAADHHRDSTVRRRAATIRDRLQ